MWKSFFSGIPAVSMCHAKPRAKWWLTWLPNRNSHLKSPCFWAVLMSGGLSWSLKKCNRGSKERWLSIPMYNRMLELHHPYDADHIIRLFPCRSIQNPHLNCVWYPQQDVKAKWTSSSSPLRKMTVATYFRGIMFCNPFSWWGLRSFVNTARLHLCTLSKL